MQILNTHFKRCSSYFKPLPQKEKIDPITTLRRRIHTPNNDSTIRKLNAVHEQEGKAIVSEVAAFNFIPKMFQNLGIWQRFCPDFFQSKPSPEKNRDKIEAKNQYVNQSAFKIKQMLTNAITDRDVRKLEDILKMGLNPNLLDNCRQTPLFAACSSRSLSSTERTEMVELLLKFGADPLMESLADDQGGMTPLVPLWFISEDIPENEHDLAAILELFYKHTGCAEEAEACLVNFIQSRKHE